MRNMKVFSSYWWLVVVFRRCERYSLTQNPQDSLPSWNRHNSRLHASYGKLGRASIYKILAVWFLVKSDIPTRVKVTVGKRRNFFCDETYAD